MSVPGLQIGVQLIHGTAIAGFEAPQGHSAGELILSIGIVAEGLATPEGFVTLLDQAVENGILARRNVPDVPHRLSRKLRQRPSPGWSYKASSTS